MSKSLMNHKALLYAEDIITVIINAELTIYFCQKVLICFIP